LGGDPITDELKINEVSTYLYSDYSNISVENVAKSNEFYRTYVKKGLVQRISSYSGLHEE
jgi:hypothetical protein